MSKFEKSSEPANSSIMKHIWPFGIMSFMDKGISQFCFWFDAMYAIKHLFLPTIKYSFIDEK